MANVRFNHQYGHCKAVNCKLKDDCVHYLALLEAEDIGLKDYKTFDHCEDLELGYVRVRIEKK